MVKIGRNAPCPCGSGKKYKRCCLAAAEKAARVAQHQPHVADPVGASANTVLVDDDLDQRSNAIVDLIDQKRLDEALAASERLLHDFPDVIDGLERFAMVHEARGDWALAADHYRRALAFTEQPEQRSGFDDDGRAYYQRKIAENEARASALGPAPDPT